MRKKLLVGVFIGGIALRLFGAVAVETVDRLVIESKIVSDWGGVFETYLRERETLPALPLPMGATDVGNMMEVDDFSFLSDGWQVRQPGGTYYLSEESTLSKKVKLPLTLSVNEDIQRGEVLILSSSDGEKYKGEVLFDAPEFFELNLSPMLTSKEKAEEDAWTDLLLQGEAGGESLSLMGGGGMMAMRSVSPEHTNDIWISGEAASNGFDVAVYCPSGVSNIEIYVSRDLVSNVWNVATSGRSPSGANVVTWTTPATEETGFFRAGNGGLDTDNDQLCDARELIVCGTDENDPDSDNDSLTDGEEVLTYGLDPNDADTNGDGVPDAIDANMQGKTGTNGLLVLLPGSEYRHVMESSLNLNSYGAYGE